MDKTIRIWALIDLALLTAAGIFLVRGYILQSGDTASIGAVIAESALAPLLITLVMGMTTSRQNGQQGWFLGLLALLVVGVLGPFVAYIVLASLAGVNLAREYGLLFLILYLALPGLAALGTLVYSRSAEPFTRRPAAVPISKWDEPQS